MKMLESDALNSASSQHWLRTGPVRFLLPLMLWCAAAATGGLFVYGCAPSSPTPLPTPTGTPTPTPTSTVKYTVSGTISGLPTTATTQALVLQDNGGDNFTASTGATSFVFATALPTQAAYSVTVLTQPTGFTCTVGSTANPASGAVNGANVVNIPVTCVPVTAATYTISGTILGLPSTATTQDLVLQDNGGDNFTAPTGATSFVFATALPTQAAYSVTILKQPTGFNCTVGSNANPASGTVNSANVTNIPVVCVPVVYTIGGTISGLPSSATSQALVLQDNGGDNFTASPGATSFVFATALPTQAAYSVTILKQPTGFTCTVGSTANPASGTVTGANVTNIPVACVVAGGLTGATILATVTNVQPSAAVFYNSTLTFYSIFSPASASVAPAAPVQIGTPLTLNNVLGIAVDSANYVYYLSNSGSPTSAATYNVCTPPLAAGGGYSCAAAGSGTLLGGQWVAVDGLGNAYVTLVQGASSGVVAFNAKAGPGTLNQQVYGNYSSASAAPGAYYGLGISVDGTTIYVSEGTAGITSGQGVKVHSCAISLTTTCADSAANDITAILVAAANAPAFGPAIEFSGALAVGPLGTLYAGEGTPAGFGTAFSMTAPVALVCTPGTVYKCATASQTFNFVEGDIMPFVEAPAIASDPSGNAYVATSLDALGDTSLTVPPAPTFMAYLAASSSATSLTPFFCGTPIPAPGPGNVAEPNCPVNMLPAPAVVNYKGQAPLSVAPYSMAITLPSK